MSAVGAKLHPPSGELGDKFSPFPSCIAATPTDKQHGKQTRRGVHFLPGRWYEVHTSGSLRRHGPLQYNIPLRNSS